MTAQHIPIVIPLHLTPSSPRLFVDIPPGSSAPSDDPTVYIWTLYFLALHYSTPLSLDSPPPNPARSLDFLQRAIEHTPTLPELLMGKARVRDS